MHNWKSPPSRFRGSSPPLLGIHSQSFTWPACTTTGHPLPAIYVAPQAPAPPLLGIQPSRLRGPSACRYWVSTPSHPRPVSATTGYPLPAIYVAHRGGPPLLGIHFPPFTWPVSGPPLLVTIPILYIAGYHSHRPFSTPRRPTCCACTTKAYPSSLWEAMS